MPPITCHILDTTRGKPAADVVVAIYRIGDLPQEEEGSSIVVDEQARPFALAKTNTDGRVAQWVFDPTQELKSLGFNNNSDWDTLIPGMYKIRFQTSKYFARLAQEDKLDSRTFFPFVEIIFTVANPPDKHYHIPLLLANHSYTTYRGS